MATSPTQAGAPLGHEREPVLHRFIDLFTPIAISYFAVILVAVVVDVVREDGLTFRSWAGFGVQAAGTFVLGTLSAGRALGNWQRSGQVTVPSVVVAALTIGTALAVGTLAGGFFPDGMGYRRRAPEFFLRTMSALVPALVAALTILRRAAPVAATSPAVAAPPAPDQVLTGDAREAALRALDFLDRGEDVVSVFEQAVSTGVATSADGDRMWAALDGPGLVACLRQMPPSHAVTNALRAAAVAQTDAAYLIALSRGAHDAVGHTAESAAEFVSEVATRRGQPDAGADALLTVARAETKTHRNAAAGVLHATRFGASHQS